mmetsp:Transcript_3550/g.10003  ORF Transcript_3550/g.10003 Transcript_3550/m.10003 type:complete len:86 (-) Transcript_3550:1158-1415(-)
MDSLRYVSSSSISISGVVVVVVVFPLSSENANCGRTSFVRSSQAMLSAPLFVWLEIIFFFGFKKELQEEVEHKAAKLIASYEKQS